MANIPLVVDLDGTLISTDLLLESGLSLAWQRPASVLPILAAWVRGRAALKGFIAAQVPVEPQYLPYHQDLLTWLVLQKKLGRRLVLCTAAAAELALPIAHHLGLFDEVMASSAQHNLSGSHKARALTDRFGSRGFDYVGNAAPDLAVWKQARKAILVNAPGWLIRAAEKVCTVEQIFPAPNPGFMVWIRALRLHQWLKNILLWVPAAAAHQLTHPDHWINLLTAFLAFGLLASALYLVNDLLDLAHDRKHPQKRLRPLAAGLLPLWAALGAVPLLATAGLALGWALHSGFVAWLLVYGFVSLLYSLWLKQLLLLDTLTLASLYTLRIVAGAAAVGLGLSFWLLAFSVFLFLSLAFLKRYAELVLQHSRKQHSLSGRAYLTSDLPLVQTLGIGAGYSAAIVLALYLNSEAVLQLYRTPEWLWATVPIMVFWISWMWVKAHRGQLHHDPLVFAVQNPTSLGAGIIFGLILWLGTLGWSP